MMSAHWHIIRKYTVCVPLINEEHCAFSMDCPSFILSVAFDSAYVRKESGMPLLAGKVEMPFLEFCPVSNLYRDLLPTLLTICVLQRYCTNNAPKDHFAFLFSCIHERSFFSTSLFNRSTSQLDSECLGAYFVNIVPVHNCFINYITSDIYSSLCDNKLPYDLYSELLNSEQLPL